MYSTKDYTLTEKEAIFIQRFLDNNDCGATTPEELLEDNFSCQTVESMVELFEGIFSSHQLAGLISSLESKGVIDIEDDRGVEFYNGKKEKLPDLYWVSNSYLESLPKNLKFSTKLEVK